MTRWAGLASGSGRRMVAAALWALAAIAQVGAQAPATKGSDTASVEAAAGVPVYTSADGTGSPKFPKAQVLVGTSTPGAAPQPGDLTAVEDGVDGNKATQVTTFEQTGYGVAVAVAVDVSGSMAGAPLKIIRDSLYKFASDARSQDAVGVLTIADDAVWDVPLSTDKSQLSAGLQGLKNRGKLTRLYDGLLTALGAFDQGLPARRELTIISDGHDEGSQAQLDDVVRMARNRGIAINAVGLTKSAPRYLQTLQSLAEQTGGSFHQAKSDAELEGLIANGMTDIKGTPVASFTLKHLPADGRRHRLGVRWEGHPALAETSFVTPEAAKPAGWRWGTSLPVWAYAALGALALLLIVAVVQLLRSRARPAEENNPVSSLPPASGAAMLVDAGALAAHPPARVVFTPTEVIPMAPPVWPQEPAASAPAPPIAPPAQPVDAPVPRKPRPAARTQIAGIFPGLRGGGVARLEILTGTQEGRSVEVLASPFWIGAAAPNDLVLTEDETASGRHAYLLFEDPILMIVDNHSTNGTRVNGELLRDARRPLRDGDEIQIGATLLRVRPAGPDGA